MWRLQEFRWKLLRVCGRRDAWPQAGSFPFVLPVGPGSTLQRMRLFLCRQQDAVPVAISIFPAFPVPTGLFLSEQRPLALCLLAHGLFQMRLIFVSPATICPSFVRSPPNEPGVSILARMCLFTLK
ncbi:hypothetical protein MTO96_008305 [Rhipicephalus appendiculatus]